MALVPRSLYFWGLQDFAEFWVTVDGEGVFTVALLFVNSFHTELLMLFLLWIIWWVSFLSVRLDLFFGPVKHICLTGGLNIYSYAACSKMLRGSDFHIGTQGHVGSLKSLVPFALHSTCWMVKMVKTVVFFFFLDNCWVTNLLSIVKANSSPSLSWRFLIFKTFCLALESKENKSCFLQNGYTLTENIFILVVRAQNHVDLAEW